MKRISTGVMVALGTVALLGIGAHSQAQLVSSLTSGTQNTFNASSISAQFTLTNAATVSSAVLSLYDGSSSGSLSDLTAYLCTDNASTPGSAFATSTGVSGTFSNGQDNLVTFTFGEPELSSGTYWLELQNANTTSTKADWEADASTFTNSGTDGTALARFKTSNYHLGIGLLYSIDGDEVVSSTPEPGSIALLVGMSAVGASVLRKRRRK